MSTAPASPELSPIADAFAAARAEAEGLDVQAEAAERARAQHAEDVEYIRECYARKGYALARRFGISQGFSNEELLEIFAQVDAQREDKKEAVKKKKKDKGDADAPPAPSRGEDEPRFTRERQPIKALPDDCPVVPVGYNDKTYYFLNPDRQLVAMDRFGAEQLRALFGSRVDWLWVNFPKFNEKSGVQSGWKADRAGESLMAAAFKLRHFEPLAVQRGLGGWRTDDGHLVLHCGDAVLVNGEEIRPGWHSTDNSQGYLYSAARAAPRPAPRPETEDEYKAQSAQIERALKHFDSWNFLDGPGDTGDSAELKRCFAADVDGSGHKLASLLLLGWLAASRAGGALRYRSLMWITGDAGTGKTTLQDALKAINCDDLVKASDPTPAGIWQTLGLSSRPVMIDEAEPDPRSRKIIEVIKLARQAATGGLVLRGSSGHNSTQFMAQSAFLFSSIIVPPMLSQDISRFAILDLGPLGERKMEKISTRELNAIGRVILRRLIDNWHRWEDTFEAYRAKLANEGHDPRGCDQYGTLLAMVDMMRGEALAHADTIDALAKALNFETMNDGNYRASNAEAMLNHLISTPLEVFRGGTRMTVGTLVAIAAGVKKADDGDAASPRACRDALEAFGIFVDGFDRPHTRQGSQARVILPNQSKGLIRLFMDSMWHGEPGAPGGWAQAMRRLPGAKKESSSRFGGRGWSVPVHVFLQSDLKD